MLRFVWLMIMLCRLFRSWLSILLTLLCGLAGAEHRNTHMCNMTILVAQQSELGSLALDWGATCPLISLNTWMVAVSWNFKLKGKLGSPRGLVETKSAVPPAGVDLSKAKSTPLGSPHGRNKECSSPRRCWFIKSKVYTAICLLAQGGWSRRAQSADLTTFFLVDVKPLI